MGLRVKDRAKPKLPPVEPGGYIAVCVGVIDLGEQFSEKFKNYRNEVQFVWELSGEMVALLHGIVIIPSVQAQFQIVSGYFSPAAFIHLELHGRGCPPAGPPE